MHATCSNCKTKLSCGCQKRTASNGVSCCTSCIASYEAQLKNRPSTSGKSSSFKILYTSPKE